MRKHDVRKWLHAVLDLLPVILIPVFMIYSHRHTIDSGSIDVPQNQVVDFNQVYNYADTDTSGVTLNNYTYTIYSTLGSGALYSYTNYDSIETHKYLLKVDYNFIYSGTGNYTFNYNINGQQVNIFSTLNTNKSGNFSYILEKNSNIQNSSLGVIIYRENGVVLTDSSYWSLQVFDLTKMFGFGNEPTLEQFNIWYPNDYYEYTLSRKELLKGTSTITYDDTDIMSQVVYQLYNSVDKYFNMGNVFNMTGVYDWFNLNIFNGNAPISIYIVWNIVLYEFVMDLLFLLYGLFMWFIDMVEKLMEKPLKSVK